MSELALHSNLTTSQFTTRAVAFSTKGWFVLAALGHWIFLAYILAVFYPPIAQQGLEGLQGMHLPSGFREGEHLGNLAAVSHVLLAAIIIGGGPLQLIPAVRQGFPRFHRWLGRSYLVAAITSSIGGLYMTWTRSNIGDLISHIGISGDGLLIIAFGILALRSALKRQFDQHRRWALRLFMVASAVWFFRVGLMGWAMLTGGIGIHWETFTGPFLYVLGFAQYLLPLIMLEWYFHCQRQASPNIKIAYVITLSALTLFMCLGIFAATMGLWLPRM
ncbi:DUF2306 domain-containing protein [Gilvimarinus sp. SDUM040013]|uniref:DUF2306 domain-containing protein n=1 Tax=Gilvimarinus gilvus TaxID=3058038 RepID=A0ABU4S184_9GAMM|nr:DUF2306 domain-containing protein [Gilvimarinus sp. SDUM040013]MDO3387163.1 DUF2306 domain-containing protein [Gilvimarinus sp. SDUM040013]MDX6850906.1 DUF2306 domain-containing protein [Gilvimarinus sp. SDUM040013]